MPINNARAVCALFLAFVLPIGLGACGDSEADLAAASKQQRVDIRVSGSGAASRLFEKLAPSYERQNNVRLSFVDGIDSAEGIAAVRERAIEIGAVAREPSAGELTRGMAYRRVATDAVAFVANGAGVRSLTRRQLKQAFAAQVTNWRQLGGADLPIVVLVRDEDESITQLLRRDLFGEDFRFARGATVLSSTEEINAGVARTRGAIGFTSHGSLVTARSNLEELAVDWVFPSVATLARGTYPFRRSLGIVFRPAAEPTRLAAFLGGDAIAGKLAQLGYGPAR